MTEERKAELRRLLEEAMENLEIRHHSGNRPSLPTHKYKKHLQEYWASDSLSPSSVVTNYRLYIVNEVSKSKLINFISEEFASFIHEGRIQSVCSFIARSGPNVGYPLDMLLEQLLKIVIAHGTEKAVSDFDRCTKDMHASFQYIALLEGIRLETEIQIFEGIRLVPLPLSTSKLQHYLPDIVMFQTPVLSLIGKTLLIIDASVSPIFHKPFPELFRKGFQEDDLPFKVEVKGGKFPKFKVDDFHNKICQALSLGCNSPVRVPLEWRFIAKNDLFNLNNLGVSGITHLYDADPFGNVTDVGQSEIEEVKLLYNILAKPNSNIAEKLQVPIDRWIKSKTSGNFIDKMIDLCIAFESLYLQGIKDELKFRLSVRAAWYLGKTKIERKKLLAEFKEIYNSRSTGVHSGTLKENVTIQEKSIPMPEFIIRAQNLCKDSILKIMKQCLKEGKYPKNDYWSDYWDDLILGEE